MRYSSSEIFPEPANNAGCGSVETNCQSSYRGLAASTLPNQSNDFTRLDVEADAINGHQLMALPESSADLEAPCYFSQLNR